MKFGVNLKWCWFVCSCVRALVLARDSSHTSSSLGIVIRTSTARKTRTKKRSHTLSFPLLSLYLHEWFLYSHIYTWAHPMLREGLTIVQPHHCSFLICVMLVGWQMLTWKFITDANTQTNSVYLPSLYLFCMIYVCAYQHQRAVCWLTHTRARTHTNIYLQRKMILEKQHLEIPDHVLVRIWVGGWVSVCAYVWVCVTVRAHALPWVNE